MTQSLNELVYSIIELYRPNHVVTDSLDERLVAKWIQSTRAKLIKQRMDSPMRLIDEKNVQSLGNVKMIPVPSASFLGFSSDKYMLLSEQEIPWPIHHKMGPLFTRVGPADNLNRKFNVVSHEKALVSGNGKFNSSEVYAFQWGNNIGLISNSNIHKQIEYINIRGIFENPIAAYEFRTGLTYDWDLEYPISESLVNDMKNMVVQENFQMIMIPVDDKQPNSIDNITNPTPEAEVGNVNNPMRRR